MRPSVSTVLALAAGLTLAAGATTSAWGLTRVSIELDGALATQAQALRALEDHGMRGTLYVNSGRVGAARRLNWSQVQAAAFSGHEIGGFSVDHAAYALLDSSAVRADACADRRTLQAHDLPVSSFAYPFGLPSSAAAPAIEAAVRSCGYSTARTTTIPDLFAESVPPVDRMATRAYQWDAGHTLADLQSAVRGAEAHGGGWIQYAFQDVCDACDPLWSIPPATFAAFLDWLAPRALRGTVVQTPTEILQESGVPVASPTAPPPSVPVAGTGSPGPVGTPGSGTPGTSGRPAPPALRSVRLLRRAVRWVSRLAVRFRLDREATVHVTAARRRGGRWVRTATSATLQGDRGTNTARFPARLLRLRPGTYRLTFVATDALGLRSGRKVTQVRVRR